MLSIAHAPLMYPYRFATVRPGAQHFATASGMSEQPPTAMNQPEGTSRQCVIKANNVVLVHGAYADGSSWADVIPILQAAGLIVTAVQNPLTSLADDVAATQRALALQGGPTVLAGYSWAGTVISEAGIAPKCQCPGLRRGSRS